MSSPDPTDLCSQMRDLARKHLSSSLPGAEVERLRAHLDDCPECKGVWAGMVETTAALGHARREVRDQETKARAMARRQMQEDESRGVAGKRSRLRLFLYPALMAILMWAVTRDFPTLPSVVVTRLAGEVSISGSAVEDAPTKLMGGQVVESGPDGRADLVLGDARIRLEPNAAVRLQQRTPLIFDLGSGSIEVTGPLTVQCGLGLADLKAGDVLDMTAVGLRMQLTARAGEPRWIDAEGELVLDVGRSIERGVGTTD